ncbi:MAG: FAD-dependent oxidoreductase [Thermoplasmata archaeon]|nr:FAD-dependent oxidoreductase [Thermoplasmata archaeon]
MRLEKHPVLDFKRGKRVTIYLDGKEVEAYEGETIAMALYAAGVRELSRSQVFYRPRGLFCAIGKCASCIMTVDGVPNVRTCITPVKDGMRVETPRGPPTLPQTAPPKEFHNPEEHEYDFLVIGGGPAGLQAAIQASDMGARVAVVDEAPRLGGQLIKQTHKFFGKRQHYAGVRGVKIAEILIEEVRRRGIDVFSRTSAVGLFREGEGWVVPAVMEERELLKFTARAVLVATGAMEKYLPFPGADLPGVYGAGAVQTLMNTYGIVPGKRVLIVGAGNVGLILAYQLMQAGVEVPAIVEALPRVGGYFVHAAKVRRQGVQILTRHTIVRAYGEGKVEGATIARLDENWKVVEGTEQEFEVDVVALSVGLRPSVELLQQAGCSMRYVRELAGMVPLRDGNMQTTCEGVYVAGDASGIEEATTAMLEGKIAGISAGFFLGLGNEEWEGRLKEARRELDEFRDGPIGEHVKRGIEKVLI